jgi:hypothetical protein
LMLMILILSSYLFLDLRSGSSLQVFQPIFCMPPISLHESPHYENFTIPMSLLLLGSKYSPQDYFHIYPQPMFIP